VSRMDTVYYRATCRIGPALFRQFRRRQFARLRPPFNRAVDIRLCNRLRYVCNVSIAVDRRALRCHSGGV